MEQNPLTVIIDIKPTERESLCNLLTAIGNDINGNVHLRFPEIPTTHFARFVLIGGGDKQDRDSQTKLYFSTNHDGDWQTQIDLIVDKAAHGLHTIFSKCKGYPNISPLHSNFKEGFRNFIGAHIIKTNTFFSAYPGQAANEIKSYIKVRNALGIILDQPQLEPLFDALSHLPLPQPKRSKPIRKITFNFIQPILQFLLTPQISNKPATGVSREVNTRPDMTDWLYTVQNEMTIISAIKPGILPLIRLKIVLWAINFLSKHLLTDGTLAGISTIHFARWAIIDNGKNLLFESNYDGNWEQYIGDFVDKANFGMDSIWGNCKGFPERGSKDIQAFKQIIVDHQVRAQVFYSAYPTSSSRNILDYIAISSQMNKLLEHPQLADWLRRI
jgi:hypothetical protein